MRAIPLLILPLIVLASCQEDAPQSAIWNLRGRTMGTSWSVQVRESPQTTRDSLRRSLEGELEAVLAEMSTWRSDSELSRFNALDSTDWFPVSRPLARVCSEAQRISERTAGAYDVTIGPLIRRWGFGAQGAEDAPPPSDDELESVRQRVGWQLLKTRVDPPALRKVKPGLEVDLSSIAKGHGVDRLTDVLRGQGFEHWFVEIGGETHVKGLKAPGRPWTIGIERPTEDRDAKRQAHLVVSSARDLEGFAVATSGNYRNYRETPEGRVAHILDPRVGRPVESRLLSVSVVAKNCSTADAWATALMASGAESALALASRNELEALFVLSGDEGLVTRKSERFRAREVK